MKKAEEIFNEQDKQYNHMFDDLVECKDVAIKSIKEAQKEAWNEAIDATAELVKETWWIGRDANFSKHSILNLKK